MWSDYIGLSLFENDGTILIHDHSHVALLLFYVSDIAAYRCVGARELSSRTISDGR